jgi:hypothetical protein
MENKGFWDSEENTQNEETSLTTPMPETYYHEKAENENGSGDQELYYEVFDKDKPKYILWSLISAVLGGISVICSLYGWGGLVVGALVVAFAIVSRVNLKYFDKITIVGLILGIFGMVFGASTIVIGLLIENGRLTDYYSQK